MKRIKGNILAEGEVTGHSHRVKVAVMEREDGLRVFEGATPVVHEEHGKIELPARRWVSGIGLEVDHVNEAIRNIAD